MYDKIGFHKVRTYLLAAITYNFDMSPILESYFWKNFDIEHTTGGKRGKNATR